MFWHELVEAQSDFQFLGFQLNMLNDGGDLRVVVYTISFC